MRRRAVGGMPVNANSISVWRRIVRDKWLYVLVLPGVLYFFVFKLMPMFGIIIAFQKYNPYLGFLNSPWIGFKNFSDFFNNPDFGRLLGNTLWISLLNIVFYFPAPIMLALLLNELRVSWYKRSIQTLVYIPHFLSWVIAYSIFYMMLTTDGGIVNLLIEQLGGEKLAFLSDKGWFRPLVIIQSIWKETGWGDHHLPGSAGKRRYRAVRSRCGGRRRPPAPTVAHHAAVHQGYDHHPAHPAHGQCAEYGV